MAEQNHNTDDDAPATQLTLLNENEIKRDSDHVSKDGRCGCGKRCSCSAYCDFFKGYKVVILFASFTCYFILCGIALTVGVYFVEWRDGFDTGSALASWLGSVHIGVLHGVAPFVGLLTDRFGFRPMVMSGGFILAASLIATSFASSVYTVLISFSIFAAIGAGFVYVPASTIVSLYYIEGRAFSNGFSTCGCGFGQFIMPFVLHAGIDAFSWRGSMFISAGLALQICVLGALMREPKIWKSIKRERQERIRKGNKLEMIGFHVYKHPGFVLLLFQLMLVAAGLSIVYVHISAITEKVGGVSAHEANLPLSLLGFSTIAGRMSSGLIGQHKSVDTFLFYILAFTVGGVVTIITPFLGSYGFIAFWAVVFGLMTAPAAALVQIMALYFVDVADLNAAFAHAAVFTAFGYIIGAPVAGWLFDVTEEYNGSFYFGGCVLIGSSLLLVWPYIHHRLHRKKLAKVELNEPELEPPIIASVLFGSQYLDTYPSRRGSVQSSTRRPSQGTRLAPSQEEIR